MTKKDIARLKRKCKRLGITHEQIAAAVEPRPVTRAMVSGVFGFHQKSRPVLDAAQRLLAAKQSGNGTPESQAA